MSRTARNRDHHDSARHRAWLFPVAGIAWGSLALGVLSAPGHAAPGGGQSFNPGFLRLSDGDAAKDIDLSWFSEKGGQAPGDYPVDVILNGERVDSATLRFLSQPDRPGRLFACLSADDLARWGIRPPARPEALCHSPVSALWPDAGEQLDSGRGQWQVSVPQKYLMPPGWMQVPPRLWEEGVPALLVNYDYSGYQQVNRGQRDDSQYLGLYGSLNVGGWRLRNISNWTRRGEAGTRDRWNSLSTWLQHDYAAGQGGMFTAGQTSSAGDLFDSFSFDGVKAESDDGMLAQNLVTWSPAIRGIAGSQALVTVRQNGAIIYQKSVPPGAFELRDINMLNGSDLQVEIREADGRVHGFTQAAASVPVLQREGRVRYSLAAGRYRNEGQSSGERPLFAQGTLALGLPAELTVYGGLMAGRDYQAGMAGVGRYSAWLGAFSADVTQARSRIRPGAPTPGTWQGPSFRLAWARSFDASGTTLNLSAYRAARGFHTFREAQERSGRHGREGTVLYPRARLQASLSQPVGREGAWGAFSLSGSRDSYRDESATGQSWTASYSDTYAGVFASLSLGLSASPRYAHSNRMLMLNLSVPLSRWRAGSSQSVTGTTSLYNGRATSQLGLTGSALDGQANYSLTQGWQNQDGGNSGSAGLSWQGGYGQATAGYSYQRDGRQWSYALRGGLVAHAGGVTLSRSLSMDGGNALVMTPGVKGVRIKSVTGLRTDWRGYTVVPNLTSYQRSRLALDVSDLPENVDAKSSDREVVPTRGALVASPFRMEVGYRALITLRRASGSIPLGAGVEVKAGKETITRGIVDNGQVYLSGLPERGALEVRWNNGTAHHCRADYRVTPSYAGLSQITVMCR